MSFSHGDPPSAADADMESAHRSLVLPLLVTRMLPCMSLLACRSPECCHQLPFLRISLLTYWIPHIALLPQPMFLLHLWTSSLHPQALTLQWVLTRLGSQVFFNLTLNRMPMARPLPVLVFHFLQALLPLGSTGALRSLKLVFPNGSSVAIIPAAPPLPTLQASPTRKLLPAFVRALAPLPCSMTPLPTFRLVATFSSLHLPCGNLPLSGCAGIPTPMAPTPFTTGRELRVRICVQFCNGGVSKHSFLCFGGVSRHSGARFFSTFIFATAEFPNTPTFAAAEFPNTPGGWVL